MTTKDLANLLAKALADTYALQVKTQFFHWNVTGPTFYELHLLFDRQYDELADAVDLIAERIRALGFISPGSFSSFTKRTTVLETATLPKTSSDMLLDLVAGHQVTIETLKQTTKAAEDMEDFATEDLCSNQIYQHEKAVWMLSSSSRPDLQPTN